MNEREQNWQSVVDACSRVIYRGLRSAESTG